MGLELDFDRLIKEVLSSGGQVSCKRHYGLDIDTYAWTADFVKDQKLRKEIEVLQGEITKAQRSLIDTEELRAAFETGVRQTKQNFLELLKDHVSKAQRHEEPIIGGLHAWGVIRSELPLMSLLLISGEDTKALFLDLPEGVKGEDVELTVATIRNQIVKCNKTIEKELSPQSRWFFNDRGEPFPYPAGCRWTKFVEGWKKVVARFDGKVDLEGVALTTEDEHAAFYLLELDKVGKLTPLREAWKK
ncbi:MAG TPA: hypothetical protein VMW89_17725 [Desulfatiglandales bacterium]|nr:hypothetical protein [Desulfatiglandales bacterium]